MGKGLRFYGKCGLPRVNVAYFFVNDNVDGIYYGIDDWGFGLWRRVWISGKRVGICLGMRLWKSGGGSCLYKMKGRLGFEHSGVVLTCD